MKTQKKIDWGMIIRYIFLSALGIVMIYPLLWLFTASLKSNSEIFSSLNLIPKEPRWDSFAKGWQGSGQYTFAVFFANTFKLVIPTVIVTVISSMLVAYGFARFQFKGKKPLFALVIACLMLPDEVVIIPRYLMFNQLGWLNSYLPIIIPAAFATNSFFIFQLVQFIRSIPKELDESARIDGCSSFGILVRIIVPLSKPAIISVIIFQFVNRWNDFLNPSIFIDSVKKYPLSLALRMTIDATDTFDWCQPLAMSTLSLVPPLLLFFFTQKYFVEGISTTGLKG